MCPTALHRLFGDGDVACVDRSVGADDGDLSVLQHIVDDLGIASARAQCLRLPVTSFAKLVSSTHKLYLARAPVTPQSRPTPSSHRKFRPSSSSSSSSSSRLVVGLLKLGLKNLYLYDPHTRSYRPRTLPAVLDFYVREDYQRRGVGLALFAHALTAEGLHPRHVCYDRPSPKLRAFLARHFGLTDGMVQPNNFLVFDQDDENHAHARHAGPTSASWRADDRSTDVRSAPSSHRSRFDPAPLPLPSSSYDAPHSAPSSYKSFPYNGRTSSFDEHGSSPYKPCLDPLFPSSDRHSSSKPRQRQDPRSWSYDRYPSSKPRQDTFSSSYDRHASNSYQDSHSSSYERHTSKPPTDSFPSSNTHLPTATPRHDPNRHHPSAQPASLVTTIAPTQYRRTHHTSTTTTAATSTTHLPLLPPLFAHGGGIAARGVPQVAVRR
ncbi:DUF738-domain-containing protein [Gonapodya prolifera JEL478]|uniref:DUF738-domain-containing protein n=1 Tax=Gonapodya prolifera (strain JEL478) TaxID=1344416 RepID=A0A139AX51_GONPJ|nr:DUF738-domain-containing protein [Gonapodya prolifera JEL478]|eukprot:KXS21322.1 DUF738-domain-containing protein [Gonapodya prolifera JEL478]